MSYLDDVKRQIGDHPNRERWLRAVLSEDEVGRSLAARMLELGFDTTSRVLEVGCGEGGIAIAVAATGRFTVGLEIDASRILTAKKRARESESRATFVEGSAYDLPFEDASFDVVLLENVIEHLELWPEAIAEISRVLRPGGLLTMTMPNRFGVRTIIADPHWQLFGLVLLPRPLARWIVVTWFKRAGSYDVFEMPSLRRIFNACRSAGLDECLMDDGLYRLRLKAEQAQGRKGQLARRLVRLFDRHRSARAFYRAYRRFVSEIWFAEAHKAGGRTAPAGT